MLSNMCSILAQVGQSTYRTFNLERCLIDDPLQYLENLEVDKEKVLLTGIVESMGLTYVDEKRYSIDTLVWPSDYFVLTQSTYNHLKKRLSGTQYFHYH